MARSRYYDVSEWLDRVKEKVIESGEVKELRGQTWDLVLYWPPIGSRVTPRPLLSVLRCDGWVLLLLGLFAASAVGTGFCLSSGS